MTKVQSVEQGKLTQEELDEHKRTHRGKGWTRWGYYPKFRYCRICYEEITAKDDLVFVHYVTKVTGTYHKDCWEKEGHTWSQ